MTIRNEPQHLDKHMLSPTACMAQGKKVALVVKLVDLLSMYFIYVGCSSWLDSKVPTQRIEIPAHGSSSHGASICMHVFFARKRAVKILTIVLPM